MVRSRSRLAWGCLFVALAARLLTTGAQAADPGNELAQLAVKVDPGVVTIEVPDQRQGSGFVLDDKGTVVTNYHVIEGATSVKVVFPDGTSAPAIGFLAIAPGRDLAILRVNPALVRLRPLPLANGLPNRGQRVAAFGAPMGMKGSISDGIVSACREGREVAQILEKTFGKEIYQSLLRYDTDTSWVQTTAPISPGNSGGPLVDLEGRVVGINTWCQPIGQSLNFAVSASHITSLLPPGGATVRPFSQLPPPRAPAVRETEANPTLKAWKRFNEIRILRKRYMQPGRGPSDTAAAATMQAFAAAIAAIQVTGVDDELAKVLLIEGDILREASHIFLAINSGTATREQVAAFGNRIAAHDTTIDVLRVYLTRKYGFEFPAEVSVAAEVDKAKASEQKTKAATNAMRIARIFMAKEDRRADAERWLRKIIDEYPDSEEAKDARELLGEPAPRDAKEGTSPARDDPFTPVLRRWSDRSGRYGAEAEYLGRDGENVLLHRADGKVVKVPMDRLSDADRKYVEEQANK